METKPNDCSTAASLISLTGPLIAPPEVKIFRQFGTYFSGEKDSSPFIGAVVPPDSLSQRYICPPFCKPPDIVKLRNRENLSKLNTSAISFTPAVMAASNVSSF
ncbi:hypothetical protein R84B8_01210 [Treponema sp. R8-4-B8]